MKCPGSSLLEAGRIPISSQLWLSCSRLCTHILEASLEIEVLLPFVASSLDVVYSQPYSACAMLYMSAHSAVRIRLNEELIACMAFVVVDVAAERHTAALHEVRACVIVAPVIVIRIVDCYKAHVKVCADIWIRQLVCEHA